MDRRESADLDSHIVGDYDELGDGVIAPWTPPKPVTVLRSCREDVLRGNTFGILGSDAPVEEKLLRFAALVPMALEVVHEARATIAALRDENAKLDRQLTEVLAECKRLANENNRLTVGSD